MGQGLGPRRLRRSTAKAATPCWKAAAPCGWSLPLATTPLATRPPIRSATASPDHGPSRWESAVSACAAWPWKNNSGVGQRGHHHRLPRLPRLHRPDRLHRSGPHPPPHLRVPAAVRWPPLHRPRTECNGAAVAGVRRRRAQGGPLPGRRPPRRKSGRSPLHRHRALRVRTEEAEERSCHHARHFEPTQGRSPYVSSSRRRGLVATRGWM